MARSRLAASRNQGKQIQKSELKCNLTALDMSFEVHQKGMPYSVKYNLLDWCHKQCDPKKALVKRSRFKRMKALNEWVRQQKKNQSSEASIRSKLDALKLYICFCDSKGLDPFSSVGYLSYAGNSGELWRLVEAAIESKTYAFQYHDGEEFGLLESSAYTKKKNIDMLLSVLDFDISEWQATIKPFTLYTIDSPTQPYTSREWYTLVRKTQIFFFSIATQLIAFRENQHGSTLPERLENIAVDRIKGRDITITVGGGNSSDGASAPFNQCMAAAYTLFAYYTAFNDTVIRDVRHPIKVVTSKIEGRTLKTSQVRAYKGRASKDVKALFSSVEENSHPEASDESAGFIIADINKRDNVGDKDGITFLETLELLSKTYSNDPYDTLIYFLDKQGENAKVSVSHTLKQLAQNLGLLSERRGDLTDHLVKTYTDVIESQSMTTFYWVRREDGARVMSKQVIDIGKGSKTKRGVRIAYSAFSCMTDVSLRNALMPLSYSDKNSDGDITVSFKYLDGSEGEFTVAAKYLPFLQLVERNALTRNPLPRPTGTSAKKPSFLLPLGPRSMTYQWKEGEVLITARMLNEFGIGFGDYFLGINSSRIRVTHSDLEYKPEENGVTAQKLLQHSLDVANKRYRNGHPVSNNKQISQGMLGLTYIAQGKTRKEAKELVKKELKIPVLEYDVWKKLNQPTNPNGISCNGRIDLESGKDWHYAARKFAEKKQIIAEGQDITCFQYDLCVFCKSAKLVDDPYSIYKLLSFLEALEDGIDRYIDRAYVIQSKIERFKAHLDDLPLETIEKAEGLLEERGRYPLFGSSSSVTQYL